MPRFSKISSDRLKTCAPDLQHLFNEVIKLWDCTIAEGHRGEERQNKFKEEGLTQLSHPHSNHNIYPSYAVDVVPYQGRAIWGSTEAEKEDLCYFAGFVKGVAKQLKEEGRMQHSVRWGGDWNNNNSVADTNFRDFPHWELIA
tara:strand:+ start:17184 stop:17612 length:429 start_codon:yes stop_codon:yes gene_type:complete